MPHFHLPARRLYFGRAANSTVALRIAQHVIFSTLTSSYSACVFAVAFLKALTRAERLWNSNCPHTYSSLWYLHRVHNFFRTYVKLRKNHFVFQDPGSLTDFVKVIFFFFKLSLCAFQRIHCPYFFFGSDFIESLVKTCNLQFLFHDFTKITVISWNH